MKKILLRTTVFSLIFLLGSLNLQSQCIPTGVRPVFGAVSTTWGNFTFSNVPTGNVIQINCPAANIEYLIDMCVTNPGTNVPSGTNDGVVTVLDQNSSTAVDLAFFDDGCPNMAAPGYGPSLGTWTAPAAGTYFLYLTEWNSAGTIQCIADGLNSAYDFSITVATTNIYGRVYLDVNTNCVFDGSENGIANIPVRLWDSGALLEQMPSLNLGTYSFATDTGTYEISVDTAGFPFYVACPASVVYYDTITSLDSVHYDRDFGLQCKPGFDLAAWSIEGRFRPGDTRQVNIHVGSASNFYGINCLTGAGITGSVTVSITGPASYVSPAPGALTPDNVSGNMLTYNVADFGTVDFNSSFNIMVQTETNAVIGSTICFTVTVSPVTGDDVPTNNVQTHCFIVVGSFDPNDKQVYPLSDVDVNGERWLTYTVNFQNTGTDTAYHIYITDTLDADLDVSTFQLLAYSHQPLVQLKENAVRFNFPNIMLVDSHANEPLSHGYVQYTIKIKDGKPVGTVINNTAYIYFDFNAPVVTNTTVNTLSVVSSVEGFRISDFGFRIYPNPANTSVVIAVDDLADGTIVITDIIGREVLKSVFTIRNPQFDIRNFESGVYFVTVSNGAGSATKKLVVE